MNTRPTPETDESTLKATNMEDIKAYKQFLKETNAELKRERDEWKAKYIQQNKDLGCELRDPNGTIWDHAKTLQRERDEARAETIRTREFMDYGFVKAQEELTDMTAQRDRLAAVLQRIRDGYGGQVANPNCCEDCDYLLPIDEALQSLTPNAEP
jgi:hypothetical protein